MSLGDPFQTTFEGARQGIGTLGQAANNIASQYAQKKQLDKQKSDTVSMLKQMGLLTEQPADVMSWEKELGKHAKEVGIDKLNVEGSADPEERVNQIKTIFDTFKLPYPKAKSMTINAEEMAKMGGEWNPQTGGVAFKPPQPKSANEEALKAENLKYMTNINKQMDGGQGGTDLIYRDPVTGEEVQKEQALQDIKEGRGQYVVNQRIATKAGMKESSVVKPADLTEGEKNYLITSKRVQHSLDDLKNNIYPRLEKLGGNQDWESFQAQSMPFIAIKDQNIQDLKSSLNRLKADIPFSRGGKQLTPMEAKRVDVLLNPFGKTKETRDQDLDRFKEEFFSGEHLMKYGQSPRMSGGENSQGSVGKYKLVK